MSRLAFFLAFLTFASAAQTQIFSSGPPASATSPTPDGRTHGVPASVLSPKPAPFVPGHGPIAIRQRRPLRAFGTFRHRGQIFVPVPVFYPIYGPDSAYPSMADPSVQADPAAADDAGSDSGIVANTAASEDALRQAYAQGVRDTLAQEQSGSRYGLHYLDSRESARNKPPASESKPAAKASANPEPKPDTSPSTVFIFKDGHQIETKNFAIMGQTLYNFAGSGLTKIELADLDKTATMKANDDRGITVKLP